MPRNIRDYNFFDFFTLIGSRDITNEELVLLIEIAAFFLRRGWIGRSGGAIGSDSALEMANKSYQYKWPLEVWLPSESKRHLLKYQSPLSQYCYVPTEEEFKYAWEILEETGVCRYKDKLPEYTQNLFGRNVFQTLGFMEANNKSQVVIYCANEDKKGNISGGTRIAVYLARRYGIRCFNIRNKKDMIEFKKITKFKPTGKWDFLKK